jgi:excinuclease UvrABC ATPase subunit
MKARVDRRGGCNNLEHSRNKRTHAHAHFRPRRARHNLKGIDVDIPRESLTVITGLSGSGKSSLAFDTIYAEGQRRYVESLSAYARQFLEMMQKPDVENIDGLSPAISIEQKTTSRNPRSTVATVTDRKYYNRVFQNGIEPAARRKVYAGVALGL